VVAAGDHYANSGQLGIMVPVAILSEVGNYMWACNVGSFRKQMGGVTWYGVCDRCVAW